MKNRKILYVDQLCLLGHVNFNNIYIKALYDQDVEIDFALRFGYKNNLNLSANSRVFAIPEKYFAETASKILHRFNLYRVLRYIEYNIDFDNYDFILFSSFEEISLFFGNFGRPLIIIHHNNVKSLDNRIKGYFYKSLIRKNINLVFDENIRSVFNSLDVKTTYVVRHGYPVKLDESLYDSASHMYEIGRSNFDRVIFAPSSSSGDEPFFLELLKDRTFQSFLHENSILFIIKGDYRVDNLKNIKIINSFLPKSEYEYLFLNSDIIILSYPESFKYRTSGVFWECVANDKLCLLSRISAFAGYSCFMKYEPFFNSNEEFRLKIVELLNLDESVVNNPYTEKAKLKPDFKELLAL